MRFHKNKYFKDIKKKTTKIFQKQKGLSYKKIDLLFS